MTPHSVHIDSASQISTHMQNKIPIFQAPTYQLSTCQVHTKYPHSKYPHTSTYMASTHILNIHLRMCSLGLGKQFRRGPTQLVYPQCNIKSKWIQ